MDVKQRIDKKLNDELSCARNAKNNSVKLVLEL